MGENAFESSPKSLPRHDRRLPHRPDPAPRGLGADFVYFYQNQKISKIFCENPLTILALCDKIVNCIIIALIMGISAHRYDFVSTRSDFSRLSLYISTNHQSARSIRLRPRHLPCPWVVRLTHETPDVRVGSFAACAAGVSTPFFPAAARESARRCPPTILNGVFYSWSI